MVNSKFLKQGLLIIVGATALTLLPILPNLFNGESVSTSTIDSIQNLIIVVLLVEVHYMKKNKS